MVDTTDGHLTGSELISDEHNHLFPWPRAHLTYISSNERELPSTLASRFGGLATKLDLSFNNLSSFKNINSFKNLTELILDNNNFEDHQAQFEPNQCLKLLSLNKNKVSEKLWNISKDISRAITQTQIISKMVKLGKSSYVIYIV